MQTILTVVHVFLAAGVIGLILMQHGKGADAGAAFGSGASGTVFGSQGASNFLSRTTAILATAFFLTSIALGYFSMQKGPSVDLMQGVTGQSEKPAVEAPAVAADMPLVPMESQPANDMPVVDIKPEATEFVAPDASAPQAEAVEQKKPE